MKLTSIHIKDGDVAKVEVEMSAQEFYRFSDALRADAERGGDFHLLSARVAQANCAEEVEKQIAATFQAAQDALKQGAIRSLDGMFAAVEG